MSLGVQQNVVKLQVSVDDSPLVEVVESQTDLCRIESEITETIIKIVFFLLYFLNKPEERTGFIPGVFFWEFSLSLHVEHEVASIYIFNNKEESEEKIHFYC